ncbi:MAG: polysaccharide biosynthesis tyrosine autokinase [Gammaproteobacteria bacterium]|nr:polysaccharide biosynthesis tyrosine autokinase [Gammaproteobacteria bacterium]MBQ0774135.1 polysaccharide biosynthesis tyrosine autokinase [Gammaproteobacteria bacterium]
MSNNRLNSIADDEIDLGRVWGLLVDSAGLIAGMTGAAFLAAVIYLLFATPIYRADALLQVEDKQGGVPGFAEMSEMFAQESSAQAEIEILRSRMVLSDVINQLGMDVIIEREQSFFSSLLSFRAPPRPSTQLFASYVDSGVRIAVEQLVLPDYLEDRTLRLVISASGGGAADEKSTVTGKGKMASLYVDDHLLARGDAETRISNESGDIVLKFAELSVDESCVFTLTKRNLLSVIKDASLNLSVSELGKNTGILRLSYKGSSRAKIKATLDAISESYLLQNVKRLSAQAQNSLDFLDKQLPDMKEKLQGAEEQLNTYRLQSESVDLTLETKSVLERLVLLEGKLNELSFKESEVSRMYTPEHPAYQTLISQRQNLQEERAKLNKQIQSLPATQQEILRLTRDVKVNQEIYVQMLNKVQELRILKAGTVGNVRIIDTALADTVAVAPRKAMVLVLAVMLGGMAGVGWVVVRAAFHKGVESPDQLEKEGLAVYATVPLSATQEKLAVTKNSKNTSRESNLLALEDPSDLAIESLRSLRTSLHFAMLDADAPVLMITGPSPGIGKSFISANLAVVLAQINKRVLLIDADMRRGHLHKFFKATRGRGLSSYLSGQIDLPAAIQPTQISSLSFMPAGEIPPNPAELLMTSSWQSMIDSVSGQYDLIIIDTPPILAVTDAAIIGQSAGAALMVVRYDVNSVKETMIAAERLERTGVKVGGAILNCVEKRAGRDHGYYSYKYESGSEKG